MEGDVYLSERVGMTRYKRSYRDTVGNRVDEVMELELTKETLLENEQSIKERFDKLTSSLGVEFDTANLGQGKTAEKAAS